MNKKEWLTGLATGTQSTEADAIEMAAFLKRIGLGKAVVTCGIVYLEGVGTLACPPTSINSVAKMILEKAVLHAEGIA